MSNFKFTPPSIHDVQAVTARAHVFKSGGAEVACLHIEFRGRDGEPQTVEAYFPPSRVQNAIATAAAINAVSGVPVDDDAEAA